MKTNTSNYIKIVTNIIRAIPITKQWVLFTPNFSVSTWITNDQILSHQNFEIISGAHTHRFNQSLELFQQQRLNGLIISFEQTLNQIKFSQILERIKNVDVFIFDQSHRSHLHSLYYSIEMEIMANQMDVVKPKKIHQIIAAFQTPIHLKKSIIHQLSMPIELLHFPHNLEACLTHQSSFNRVLWVAQTINEANAISAYLSFVKIEHALIHKKVEESIKVKNQARFIHNELNTCVTTIETQLPLDIQGIDCVTYTFDVRNDQLLSFFVPYVSEYASWILINWFKSNDFNGLGHAINENMFSFIHYLSRIEGGASMREAERTLNIDSYEFERIIKFLKGRKIIKKIGLNYIVDQSVEIHSLYEEAKVALLTQNNIKIIKLQHEIKPFPTGVIFPFVAKKMLPRGFYNFTNIPQHLKHEDGFIFISQPDVSIIKHFVKDHHIECVIDTTALKKISTEGEWIETIGLPVIRLKTSNFIETTEAKNPYQHVKAASKVTKQLVFPELKQFNKIVIIVKNYDEGWFLSVLSIALKHHAPHCQIYPICLNF